MQPDKSSFYREEQLDRESKSGSLKVLEASTRARRKGNFVLRRD